MGDLYDALGVRSDADSKTIKRAYRKAAQRAHPDKPGGNADQFRAIQHAYNVLSDDSRRASYDANGDDAQPRDERAELLNGLAHLFVTAIDQLDPDTVNLVVVVREKLGEAQRGGSEAVARLEKDIRRRERAIKRLRHKADGADFVRSLLEGDIGGKRRAIEMHRAEIAKIDKVIAILADYEYDTRGLSRCMENPFVRPAFMPFPGGFR